MFEFREVPLDDVPWTDLQASQAHQVFQSIEWLTFLAASQRGRVVVAKAAEAPVFLFGLVVRRFGLRMFGSPLKGWTTPTLGFANLEPASQVAAVEGAISFAFHHLRCQHVELADPALNAVTLRNAGLACELWHTRHLDLTQPESELLAGFSPKSCRYSIRKAERLGVQIHEVPPEGFAETYHKQLVDVFARRNLVPTYGCSRVRELCAHLQPGSQLKLFQAHAADGAIIATGLFPGAHAAALFWGGASRREALESCPNELLMWHAIRAWKAQGAAVLDLGGDASYKRKYGGRPRIITRVLATRPAWIGNLRILVKRSHRFQQRLLGYLLGLSK